MVAQTENRLSVVELRKNLMRRHGALVTERSSWVTHWSDVGRHLLPRNGRFFVSDRNRSGRDRYNQIWDSTGTRALRVLGAGMMAGATSPARPWFRLAAGDPELNDYYPVKLWLEDTVRRMQRVFSKSNTYRALHQLYEELGAFGTAVSIVLPDFENVIHHYPVACGEYCLQQDYQGKINAVYREFEKTVGEVVNEFGEENCSSAVRNQYRERNLEAGVTILHVIEPRDASQRDTEQATPENMPWRSVYIEVGGEDSTVLRDSGFQTFPVLAPRWAVAGGDVYGHSPGMEALGDVRQLQQEQLRKGQAIDYKTRPPLQVPTSMKDRDRELFPNGITYYEPASLLPFDQVTPGGGIRSAFEVNLDLEHLLEDIRDVRERIRGAFYADLFLMLANAGPDTRMTATEVAERHEEKLLMLGPVLERLHNELLKPLIDLTFDRMLEAGALLPPPPQELQGMDLQVEFISILAQAQRAIGMNNVDRFIGGALTIADKQPEVLDKVDFDRWVDRAQDMLGVPPELVREDDKVAALRDARNKAMAAKEAVAASREQAATTKDLAASPTGGQTALSGLMENLTGYSTPTATPGASPL